MEINRKLGRPIASRNICVIPEFRKEPDIEKLGRALIAIAKNMADEGLDSKSPVASGKGDGVP